MKKRYQVTLSEENVEEIKRIIKKYKFRPNVLSEILDDALRTYTDILEIKGKCKQQGQSVSVREVRYAMQENPTFFAKYT